MIRNIKKFFAIFLGVFFSLNLTFAFSYSQVSFASFSVDTPVYNPLVDTDGLKFSFSLQGLEANQSALINLFIYTKDNQLLESQTIAYYSNDSVEFPWDGKVAGSPIADGDYIAKLQGNYGDPGEPAHAYNFIEKELQLSVKRADPTFEKLAVSKNPYNYKKDSSVNFSYNLQNTSNATTVKAVLYAKDSDTDANNDKKIFQWADLTNQGPGQKVLTWDGKDLTGVYVPDGDYYFKVEGQVGDISLKPQQIDFKVSTVFTISHLQLTPSTISPDGDGIDDTTTLTYDLSDDAEVTMYLGTPIDAPDGFLGGSWIPLSEIGMKKSAGSNSFTWNGKILGGIDQPVVAPGTYPLIVWTSKAEKSVNITIAEGKNATCGGFTDVPENLCPAFKYAREQGVFLGDSGTTIVRPLDVINRVEAAAVILRGFHKPMLTASETQDGFSDVDINQWYMKTGIVRSAKEDGVLKGYLDGTLKPEQQVSRAELIVMFARASGKELPEATRMPFMDTPINETTQWYIKAVNAAKVWEWVKADPSFYPAKGMTRGDVAKLFYDFNQVEQKNKVQ